MSNEMDCKNDYLFDVCVLMTTYNPKKFLHEQINSILNQKNVRVKIIIRDDASTDKTYLKQIVINENIQLIEGEKNLGVQKNILELIRYAYKSEDCFDYFAYSDQDDVWNEDKLITAIHALKSMNEEKPCLYYSNLMVVNEDLMPSHELFKRGIVKNTFGQALSQIFLFACTSVFNRKMVELILSTDIKNLGFDHFIYYLAILKGCIYYDDEPKILYRQHGDNVSGVKMKGMAYFLSKVKILFGDNEYSFSSIATQLLMNMKDYMNEDEKDMTYKVANVNRWEYRFKVIFDKRIRAGYYPKDFYRILRILLNRY